MKQFIFLILAVSFTTAALSLSAQQQTWSGKISDSLCGAVHPEDADAAGGGKQGLPDEHDCTIACVRGGSKYVFLSEGKTYQISNQDLALLTTHAGHSVKLTGELKGDTITVSKIEM